jgi:CRISP-associated protein Cas1
LGNSTRREALDNVSGPQPHGVETDDLEWFNRCDHWSLQSINTKRKPAKREKGVAPLILSGHGVTLKIDAGTLLIRNGFTHYPQKQETFRYFKGDPWLPPRIIMLDGSGTISFDVLSWLSEQNVPLIRINWAGEVVSVLSGYGYAANKHRVAWQVGTQSDERQRMEFCNKLITRKIEGCILTLEKSVPRSDAWEKAMERTYADLTELELRPPLDVTSLRTLEANSAAAYFRAWRSIPIQWRESSRHPIPQEWRTMGPRTSRFNLAGNRNASHPINAILNYAYAILESQLKINAISDGYDPTIGIMHYRGGGSPAFIFDLMEPERPNIDRIIIEFIKADKMDPSDFFIGANGVVRLNPQMASHVVRMVSQNTTALRIVSQRFIVLAR